MTKQAPENSFHAHSRAQWRAWLKQHHRRGEGLWLVTYKKATGKPRLDYDEIVEEALCFGWIDSKPNKLDDERTMLWLAPRKPKTGWSKPNKDRVKRLIANKKMTAAGMAVIEAAQRDGSWNALDAVEALEIPADLATALNAHPPARAYFEAFPRSVKRGLLEWVANAKQAPTRAKRIDDIATRAAKNERANQWKAKT
jgi:uncharacterized protein YdeI (YjbR/CyaY-like superfamily)